VLLGLSAGWELWGVLGAPVALLSADRRVSLRIFLVQSATTAGLFAPFFLSGPVRMFGYKWFVTVQSPLSLILPVGTPVPWGYRLAQGVVAVSAGAGVALLARRSPHATWEVPAAVIAGRFLLEPVNFRYYWLGIWTLALIAGVELAAGLAVVVSTTRPRTLHPTDAGVTPAKSA